MYNNNCELLFEPKMIDRKKPYIQLPKIPPLKEKIETTRVLKGLIKAHKELSALKGEARGLSNQEILFTTLPLQEASSSCQIENIVTTQDKIYEALSFPEIESDPLTKEVINYREAVIKGLTFLDEYQNLIITRLFQTVCSTLKGTDMQIRQTTGTQLVNSKNETVYTPPEGEYLIKDLLKNLEDFLNTTDDGIDDLVKMCVAHYQFEAIHPFADGNGRTGRILNILFLIQKKLLDYPILYLSHHINHTKEDYYKKLQEVTFENKWESWILYMLEAVEKSSYQTRKKIEEIKMLFEKQHQTIKNLNLLNAKDLTELIFKNPYLRIKHFEEQRLGTRITGTKHLNALVNSGILIKEKRGRDLLYINKDLWAVISDVGKNIFSK